MNTLRREWVFMWSTTPIIQAYWPICLCSRDRKDVYSNPEIFSYFDGTVMTTYVPEDILETHRKESVKFLDQKFFHEYQTKYFKEREAWWKWIRKVETKSYQNTSTDELVQDLRSFTLYARDSMAYFGSTRPEFTFAAEQRLEIILKPIFSSDWTSRFGVLSTALVLDDIQKEYLDWLLLLTLNPTKQMLLEHVSRYPWLVFGQFDDRKVLEFLESRRALEKGIYYEEKERLEEDKRKLHSEQEKIYAALGEHAHEARYLALLLQTQSVERMNIKSYWAGSYYLARTMWNKIAEKVGLPLADILGFIIEPEVEGLLLGSFKNEIKSVLLDRKKSHALIFESDTPKIVGSYEADILFRKRIQKPKTEDTLINGQIAMVGKVKGRVRKVLPGDLDMLQEDIKNFKHGEILVTSMTQPNMMVIAHRAAAIVADEGGITSHAAIIARELKIPCVVGCRHAMNVLKDGDLVEVDAERGIVRILEK